MTNVAKALQFFGISCRTVTIAEFLSGGRTGRDAGYESRHRSRLLCSAETFLRLITQLDRMGSDASHWNDWVHSVFVYMGNDSKSFEMLVRTLTGDAEAAIAPVDHQDTDFVVSGEANNICGVMAGVRITAAKAPFLSGLSFSGARESVTNLVSSARTVTFLKLEYHKVPIFLSSSGVIDLDADVETGIFDIREHASSALPIVLYIKWAFDGTCWNPAETNACLIIDDPLLKSRHGFVNFRKLLSLMKDHGFCTNVAFIPWNWRRSAPDIVRLFKENPERYSISVHGCDHTRAEFGSSDRARLYCKARHALERMADHESRTGIPYDRVMVFPQGVFSEAAMSALKHTDLIGAVNNDTINVGPQRCAPTIAELWDTAVMRYDSFPIFTRRYPWEGIENFAFDILLGKPVIIVIHHDYCSDQCRRLVTFIDQLNQLKSSMTWRSLSEVVRRSYRQRELVSGLVEVEMYGTGLHLENRASERKRYLIRKHELQPTDVQEVRAGSKRIAWKAVEGDRIQFEIELGPGEKEQIDLRFHDLPRNGRYQETLTYRARTSLRRYFSEIRDNYLTPTRLRLAGSR